MDFSFVKTLSSTERFPFRYSICTLVSKPQEYQEMINSFIQAGFSTDLCEYLCIDNSKTNTYDAFGGLNRFLREAKGEYIILCHQDILLHDHNINDLDKRIEEMDFIDANWGILSNAGGINLKYVAMHVTQNSGNRLIEHLLPLKTKTVDENFILVKSTSNLALSHNLKGFHMYGTDICLICETLGLTSYIIDFNLTHKSNGNADASFYKIRKELMRKYRLAWRGRFISTTITRFYISGNNLAFKLFNTGISMFLARQYYKFFRRKNKYYCK
ncbi:MAG: hypothetical protein JWN56_2682 [Sphingobacteriales bacterium]|nr:hypothetical protein [Sphingobacteriales bacterium]